MEYKINGQGVKEKWQSKVQGKKQASCYCLKGNRNRGYIYHNMFELRTPNIIKN